MKSLILFLYTNLISEKIGYDFNANVLHRHLLFLYEQKIPINKDFQTSYACCISVKLLCKLKTIAVYMTIDNGGKYLQVF